mmetsp:Transcript_39257/g.113464  ORF Transcript_39257/g.113464 Transcript_39257/m.113464 type:complete len:202 (+) Transcript_39257:1245-1850(+)
MGLVSRELALLAADHEGVLAHPRILDESLERIVIRIVVGSDATHIAHESEIAVLGIVPGDLHVPQQLGPGLALEIGSLVVDQDDLLELQRREPRDQLRCFGLAAELWKPCLWVLRNLLDDFCFMVAAWSHWRIEKTPLAVLLVGAALPAGPVWKRPDASEVDIHVRRFHQVDHSGNAARISVPREACEDPSLPAFPAAQLG